MNLRKPAHCARRVCRHAGLSLAIAFLLAEAVSALLPAYGAREVLFWTTGAQPWESASADFNCDGRADVFLLQAIFRSPDTFPVRFLLADGQGSFTDGTAQVITGNVPRVQHPRDMVVEDFNGDGRPDIFVADFGQDSPPFPGYQSTLLLSTTGCRMVDATGGLPQQRAASHAVAAADVDADGDLDLFLVNYFGGQQPQIQPQILLNDGAGRFTILPGALPEAQGTLSQNSFTTAGFVDVDGDGDADLVLGGDNFTQSKVVLNDGAGHFTLLPDAMPAKPFAPNANVLDIKNFDLNGDGWQDLLLSVTKDQPTYYQGRWIQVLINNGNGTFRDETATRMPQTDNLNTWFIFIELVDVDGDGHLDVVGKVPYVNSGGTHVFWINNGAGVFTQATLFTAQNGLDGVFSFVDLVANGHRDLLSIGEVQTSRRWQTGAALPPGIPQGVRASRTLSDRVRLFWPYVWGATQYEVWRSTVPGQAGTQIGTTTATSFDDETAGTTAMYYSVRAVNGVGSSGASAAVPGNVLVPIAPAVGSLPDHRAARIGGSLQFTCSAAGAPAPNYQWQASLDNGGSWSNVVDGAAYVGAMTSSLLVNNVTPAINGIRYRCTASNSLGSAASNASMAVVTAYLPFTDQVLTARASPIRAVHVTELRSRIQAARARYQLAAFAYTTPAIVPGVTAVRAVDVLEMRTALLQAYLAAGVTAPSFGTTPASGVTVVRGDIAQLRAALVVLEPLGASLFDFMGSVGTAQTGVRFQGVETPLANGALVNAGAGIYGGGVWRNGIFVHPPYQGQMGGETFFQYSVSIPASSFLHFTVGVADDAQCTDGVTFRVSVNGTNLWQEHRTRTGFRDVVLPLDAYAGATVPLRFTSHPGPAGNPNCDWSLWTGIALGSSSSP